MEKLFTPFYRSPLTSSSAAGIGLAVCKRLIEAGDGVVWANPPDIRWQRIRLYIARRR